VKLQGNISFIDLENADPTVLKTSTSESNSKAILLKDDSKELKRINDIAAHGYAPEALPVGESIHALRLVRMFIARKLKQIQDRIRPIEKSVLEKIAKGQESHSINEYETECFHAVTVLTSQISALLYEYYLE
jgi:hypothetical protein